MWVPIWCQRRELMIHCFQLTSCEIHLFQPAERTLLKYFTVWNRRSNCGTLEWVWGWVLGRAQSPSILKPILLIIIQGSSWIRDIHSGCKLTILPPHCLMALYYSFLLVCVYFTFSSYHESTEGLHWLPLPLLWVVVRWQYFITKHRRI